MNRRASRGSEDGWRSQRGFTLLELIAVAVILVILVAVTAPRFLGRVGSTKVKLAQAQLAGLEQVIELYRLDVGRVPNGSEGLNALFRDPGVPNWTGPYIRKRSEVLDPWGREFEYRSPGQYGEYDLYSYGADGTAGGEGENADITSWEDAANP